MKSLLYVLYLIYNTGISMSEFVKKDLMAQIERNKGAKRMSKEKDGFAITIDLTSSEPIYRQIMNNIINNIAGGILEENDKLPSSRELSTILGINYHTVNKAYSYLEQEKYIYMDRRKRVLVGQIASKSDNELDVVWETQMRNLLSESISKGYSPIQIKNKIDQVLDDILGKRGFN